MEEQWVLFRVGDNCEPIGGSVRIESTPYLESGEVVINESGVGIASLLSDDPSDRRISFRALGPNLCDAPVGL